MVEQLRKSVADLEAPSCDACKVEMRWYSAHGS